MTEYEINKAVAIKALSIGKYELCDESGIVKLYVTDDNGLCTDFNPCNKAQQALDIMLKHNISVTKDGDGYYAVQSLLHIGCGDWRCDRDYYHEKPFVAAMLLFLEI